MSDPFDLTKFQELLVTKTFGRNLLFEASVGSTMDLARDAAAHGAVEGTVVLADEQTAGRGRLGRSWVTPRAANLASTIVLRPPAHVLREVAMMTPFAIVQAIASVTGMVSEIKWPNDVQMGGKKLAGVLIESLGAAASETRDRGSADTGGGDAEAAGVVLVGAGINANFDPRGLEEIRDIATSLMVELGREVEREALLAAYLWKLEDLYQAAKGGVSVLPRWRERLVTLGKQVTATSQSGVVSGLAEDVEDDGALVIRTDAGERIVVEAADVTLRV
jgi:BirA family biotin operon repressor/biotin-[acetyl-CoA-carboxylase] ligase